MKPVLSVAAAVFFAAALTAQQEQLPRFRSGTNLVSVDAYFSKDGSPVSDLTADEIELFEDERPQKIEGLRLVKSSGQGSTATRSDPIGSAAERDAVADPEARVFVLFFDQWHVSFDGSSKTAAPVTEILNRVIGSNDLVGTMTPELPARNISFTRRTSAIERMVRNSKDWGERDKFNTSDPRENELLTCYPDNDPRQPQFRGVAKELIERRREQKTLAALNDLVTHLGNLRDERKFVVLLSEGWVQFARNDRLGSVLVPDRVPGPGGVGVGVDGRLTTGGTTPQGERGTFDSCERERVMLSYVDHTIEIRQLAQRANRANVTFYGVDPRGLAVFDDSIAAPFRPANLADDAGRMTARQGGLRELAENTDGAVVLNTNDVRGGVSRMMADLGSYYLMHYYSTNAKLDGRFRRIRVRVKREGVEVRARAGYLAPTEAEMRAAGGTAANSRTGPPASVTRALDAIAPARGNLPVRIQAAGARGTIRAVVELDAATLKQPEWASGGSMRVTVTPERGGGSEQAITLAIDPGQRSVPIDNLSARLAPGRYSVRAELTPKSGRIPIQATTFAIVPAEDAVVSAGTLALRRGPSTGLAYIQTADPRYRRTERLKVEVPLFAEGLTATGRILTREGHALPLVVTYSTRVDQASSMTFGVADVTLAPLSTGEYVLELSFAGNGKSEQAAYGFRIVP